MDRSRLWSLLTRSDPLFFSLRVLLLLPLLSLLTLTRPFVLLVEEPLNRANAVFTHLCLRALGSATTLDGCVLRSPRFSMEVVTGCTGLFTFILLFTIVVAYPARWSMKLKGFLAGVLLIALLNQVRLVTLFLIGEAFPGYFEEIHIFVWQGAIITIVILYWYLWARRALGGLEPARAET